MKAYVISTYYESMYSDYEKIISEFSFIKNYHYKAIPTIFKYYDGKQIIYNRHMVELTDLTEFCSFINDCLKTGHEVIIKRENDDEPYFTFEIYDDYRE